MGEILYDIIKEIITYAGIGACILFMIVTAVGVIGSCKEFDIYEKEREELFGRKEVIQRITDDWLHIKRDKKKDKSKDDCAGDS